MLKYTTSRVLQLLPVILCLTLLTYLLTYIAPSDPAQMMFESMGAQPSPEALASMRTSMGLDRPFFRQYLDWLGGVLHGDFGKSVRYGEAVWTEITRRLPYTIGLASLSFLIMLLVSLPLGIASALYRNGAVDYAIRFLSFLGASMPSFWAGMIFIYVFAIRLKLLPSTGFGNWRYILLPAATLSFWMISQYIRRIRAAILEECHKEYVVGAAARGIGRGRIFFVHILPNSLLSIVTMMGMSFGSLLGGTTIIESIFGWPGVGKMAADSITSRDYALIQGYVIWMAFIYVLVNLAVDLSYHFLDPRIRLGNGQK